MAILHVERARGVLRRRTAFGAVFAVAAVVAAVGAAWIDIRAGALIRPGASMPSHAAVAPQVERPAAAVAVAVGPSNPGELANAPQLAGPGPAHLQALASLYADCQESEARRVNGMSSPLEESYAVDPSGALADASRDDEQRRLEQCRQVGTAEYRQIQPLMREAARLGEPRARFFLIEQTLRRLTELAAEARASGEIGTAAEAARAAQAEASVRELEQMALQGWLPAMKTLAGGLLDSDQLLPADPLRAAAWNLVASQPADDHAPLTLQDLEASGSLTPLSAEDSALVLHTAQALREACCASQSSTITRSPAPGRQPSAIGVQPR